MAKLARMSSGKLFQDGKPYPCKYDWPVDCFCQGGDSGLVFTEGTLEECLEDKTGDKALQALSGMIPHYKTAFFEAFPINPINTFIRGEGETIEEAEKDCWDEYQKYLSCSGHEFEERGYTNGAGFCKHCGMFSSGVFDWKFKEDCLLSGGPFAGDIKNLEKTQKVHLCDKDNSYFIYIRNGNVFEWDGEVYTITTMLEAYSKLSGLY